MLDSALLLIAAFAGGALNAVAGGGSFLTLPALVYTGMPALAANATGTFALLPGYLASAWGFRHDLETPPGIGLSRVALLALIGGALGAGVLLATSEALFRELVPWLLLAATAVFAAGPRLLRFTAGRTLGTAGTGAALLLTCAYGGYFNGGLGIVLLAVLSLLGQTGLAGMNGLKNLLSALLTAIAVIVYAGGGLIHWHQAFLMMLAAIAGGYVAARISRQVPAAYLRAFIIFTGLVMAALFFVY